jgi:DHA3 family macrolide efflux protein-like MFS transporter
MHYRSLSRNRNYRLLWFGHTFSTAGSALSSMGLLWYASINIGSPALAGLIGAVWGLPSILSFVAGIVVDQMDRRRLMIKVDSLSALLVLILASAIFFQQASPPFILILIFVLSLAREFFEAASFAFLPSLIDKERIAPANSLLNTTRQGALALARVVGGGLLSLLGVTGLLIIDAISYIVSALSLSAITASQSYIVSGGSLVNVQKAHILQESTDKNKVIYILLGERIADLKAGFLQMWSIPLIAKVVPWALPANAAYGAILTLMPSWVARILNSEASVYGLMIGSGTAGFMIGALLAPLFATRYQANWIMGVCTLLEAVALFFFTLTGEPTVAIVWYTVFSLFDGLSSPVFFSLLQVQVPIEHLGRIFGGLMTLLALSQPLGMSLAGILAERSGLFAVYILASLLVSLAGVYFLWAKPLRVHLPS